MTSAGRYALYAVEGSYYAAKTRSQLLRKGIPFDELACDRRAFAEVIVPRVGYPVVPVVITPDGETLQDTAEIFAALEARHPEPALMPATPVRGFAACVMELLADEWLKLPALHYRWYYDADFAEQMMGYNNDPHASIEEQRRVGAKIAAGFSTWPKHLGVTESTRVAVEASLLDCLALLQTHFSAHDFAFGAAPCLADCAMMGPLYAHLYRDPYSGAVVRERAPALCAWIERMRASEPGTVPEQAVADVIPDTIRDVLRHLGRDCAPTLADANPLLQAWLGNRHTDEIPRYVGKHRFMIGRGKPYAAAGLRSIHPFELWKAQRLRDRFDAAAPAEREHLRAFCDLIECGELLRLEFPNRLERRNFRLVRADA
ncbi:MAG: glutathione S-transferase family protein [Gammaproteobacteria bacterium]|jgi:glutathione S-transferase